MQPTLIKLRKHSAKDKHQNEKIELKKRDKSNKSLDRIKAMATAERARMFRIQGNKMAQPENVLMRPKSTDRQRQVALLHLAISRRQLNLSKKPQSSQLALRLS